MPDGLARRLTAGTAAEAKELLTALLTAADESFFYVDLSERSLTWSRGVEVILGYPPNAVGRSWEVWHERVHPSDRGRVIKEVRVALRECARVWTGRLRVARADETYVAVRVRASILRRPGNGAALLGAMIVEDDSDERAELLRQVDELRERSMEAERRAALITRSVADAVYEWDPETDTARHGDGWRRLFGYDAPEVSGGYEWWIDRVHPDDRAGVIASSARLREGGDRWVAAYRFRCADGSYASVRDRGYAVRTAAGARPRIIGAVRRVDMPDLDRPVRRLTPRQAEVLGLIRAGHSSKEIAARLGIGEQAVKGHVSNLFKRFGVPNRAALVAAAQQVRIEVT